MRNYEEKFVRHFGSSAPDLLSNIQAQPVVEINSEKELFAELDRIKDKTDAVKENPGAKSFKRYGLAAAVAVIIICVAVFLPLNFAKFTVAGNIIIDCNPSFNISITKTLRVMDIYALNDDGAEIIENIDKNQSVDKVITQVVDELENSGYISEKDDNILVSYCYKNDRMYSDEIKEMIDNISSEKVNIIYQSFKEEKDLQKKAEENNVSVGKYKFVKKINDKSKQNRTDLFEMKINEITAEVDEELWKTGNEEIPVSALNQQNKTVAISEKTTTNSENNNWETTGNQDKKSDNNSGKKVTEETKNTKPVANDNKNSSTATAPKGNKADNKTDKPDSTVNEKPDNKNSGNDMAGKKTQSDNKNESHNPQSASAPKNENSENKGNSQSNKNENSGNKENSQSNKNENSENKGNSHSNKNQNSDKNGSNNKPASQQKNDTHDNKGKSQKTEGKTEKRKEVK